MKHKIAAICSYCKRQITIGVLQDGQFSHGTCKLCREKVIEEIENYVPE